MAAYLLKKEVEKITLDSKSTLFEVINNFRLYNRVCIMSVLSQRFPELFSFCRNEYITLKTAASLLLP